MSSPRVWKTRPARKSTMLGNPRTTGGFRIAKAITTETEPSQNATQTSDTTTFGTADKQPAPIEHTPLPTPPASPRPRPLSPQQVAPSKSIEGAQTSEYDSGSSDENLLAEMQDPDLDPNHAIGNPPSSNAARTFLTHQPDPSGSTCLKRSRHSSDSSQETLEVKLSSSALREREWPGRVRPSSRCPTDSDGGQWDSQSVDSASDESCEVVDTSSEVLSAALSSNRQMQLRRRLTRHPTPESWQSPDWSRHPQRRLIHPQQSHLIRQVLAQTTYPPTFNDQIMMMPPPAVSRTAPTTKISFPRNPPPHETHGPQGHDFPSIANTAGTNEKIYFAAGFVCAVLIMWVVWLLQKVFVGLMNLVVWRGGCRCSCGL